MAAMTSLHVELCCRLMDAHTQRLPSLRSITCQFLIYRTFVLDIDYRLYTVSQN